MDRYGELVVFTRAVADGGFSAAARSLSLTPSAVSKLVSRLEDRLAVRLFSRSSRQVVLTPEGEAFYAAALRAIDAVEEADLAVAPGNLLGETLRIRSMPTFGASQLAPLIPAFRRQHPSLRIEVHLRMEPGNLLEGDGRCHPCRPSHRLLARRQAVREHALGHLRLARLSGRARHPTHACRPGSA